MLHPAPPPGFESRFTIVACAIEIGGRVLVLKRAAHKPQGGMWGMPAGKVDAGEDQGQAILREVREETGVNLRSENLGSSMTWYVVWSDYSFVYTLYRVDLTQSFIDGFPEIKLHADEHTNSQWLTPQQIVAMKDGMEDLDTTTAAMYDIRS